MQIGRLEFEDFILRGEEANFAITRIKSWVTAVDKMSSLDFESQANLPENAVPDAIKILRQIKDEKVKKDIIETLRFVKNARKNLVKLPDGREKAELEKEIKDKSYKANEIFLGAIKDEPELFTQFANKMKKVDFSSIARDDEIAKVQKEAIYFSLVSLDKTREDIKHLSLKNQIDLLTEIIKEKENLIPNDFFLLMQKQSLKSEE